MIYAPLERFFQRVLNNRDEENMHEKRILKRQGIPTLLTRTKHSHARPPLRREHSYGWDNAGERVIWVRRRGKEQRATILRHTPQSGRIPCHRTITG